MGGRSSAAQLKRFFPSRSASTRAMLQIAARVVDLPVNVLITGETGSGKDYLAEAIHRSGPRRNRPFLRVDCGAIPGELFESELFGYEKGSFTDARHQKRGRLEMASGGTVYLDDIASLDPVLQPKLLRLIQERRFSRIGGSQSIDVDLRFVASSSLPFEQLARGVELRNDLFYRLNVVSIAVPALRDRSEDIPLLAAAFLTESASRLQRNVREMDDDFLAALRAAPWPGNIRQLRNVIERAVLMAQATILTTMDLPPEIAADVASALVAAEQERWTLEQLERSYIARILSVTQDNFSEAARILGINRKTLLEKRKRYGLQ
jgi:DNA-binding NtrC family response regulator